jgi:hypothetical protein
MVRKAAGRAGRLTVAHPADAAARTGLRRLGDSGRDRGNQQGSWIRPWIEINLWASRMI